MSKKVSADSDLHRTLSPPPSASHVGERHGTHYASAGDITSLSRPDTTSQSDSPEALGNPNQETLYHTVLEMDQSSQNIPSGVNPDTPAHSDPTLRVHEDSTGQEDTGKLEDMDDNKLYPLFSDDEFSKMNVASIIDSQDNSPRQISFGADYSIPDRLENDSMEFTSFDDVMLTSTPVREKRKMKKTDNLSAALVFKTSFPITQLTNDSDDAGLKHEERIIDAGIHIKEKVESSVIDDFPLSDGKELEYNASELQSQDVNAKDSTSKPPSVTTPVSSSSSRERDNVQADIDTENLVYTYSQDVKLLPTVSQRSSSELPTPVKPFKGESLEHQILYAVETAGGSLEHQALYAVETAGESLEHQTLYAVETAGGDKDNESHAVHKQNRSVDDIPSSSIHGVNCADAPHTISDDSSATNSLEARSFVLHCKDLASIVEAKMINSSKKALSVRFSDEIIEIPPPDEFEMEQHDAHDSTFPIIGSSLDSLNIETGPALDSLDSMIDGTSIMKVNANILIGLRVTGSVEMMKMHQKKMNGHGKNYTPGSEMSLQGDQNSQNLEERGFKNTGEGSHSISHGGKTFQEDFQIEQPSIIAPHQSTDFAQTYLVQETELQSKEEDLTEKSIDTQHSYVLIQSASNDVIEFKLPVEEAEGKIMSLDHPIESQGASHQLDHLIQDGTGEQSIKTEETGEKCLQSHKSSTEDLASNTEIEHTIDRVNVHGNYEGFGKQPVEHEQVFANSVVNPCIENTGQSVQQVVQTTESESESSRLEDQNYLGVEEGEFRNIGEGSHSCLLSALDSHSLGHKSKIFQQDFQIEQSSHIMSHESVDSAESLVVKDTDLPSRTEEKDISEKSIETQVSYALIDAVSNDVMEFKLPVEEAEGKTKSLDHPIESQGASHKLDHLIQGGICDQSIKSEETSEQCLQSHKSSTEDIASSTEIEHTIERLDKHENHEEFGEQPVEHEQVLEKSVVKHCIKSTVWSVQQANQASEAESEASSQEEKTYQSLGEGRFKDIGEGMQSCLLSALDSHSVSHRGKIFQEDFKIERSTIVTPHKSTDCVEAHLVKDIEQQSSEEEELSETSIETQPRYVVIQGLSNINELKPPVEEADGKPMSLDIQIESQGASHEFDHLFQGGTGEQSIKIEETVETCLQSHKSSTEDLASSIEIEHTSQRSSRYENHEGFGVQPVEHEQVLEKSVVKSCIQNTGLSVQQAVQASEAGFEASFQEDKNYQRVKERGFKYIIEDRHSCLLPVLDSHSVSHKGKIFQQDFQNEQSSFITPHQSTYSAEFYFVKDMEQQSKEEKEEQIIGVSMETQPIYAVIQGAINDVIELKPPVAEAEAKSMSIDHQIESQGASHKLDHLIQDGTGEQSIKTEETGEKCLQSHKSSTEDLASSTEIEHTIEKLDKHENHEGFGEQPVVHEQVSVKSTGKSCTASIGQSVQQAAQTSECFRNCPPSLPEPYMSLQEAAKKEPMIYPINAASDCASLKKVALIDQLQQDGRTPLKNVEDDNVLSTFTSDIKLNFANSEDSLSIRRSSLQSVVQPEHGQLYGSMFEDRTRYAETEVYQDSTQGKHDEEHSVPQKVTNKKDVSQPKLDIRQIEEDLEPTLDISHFPGLKIKPRTRKIHLSPAGAGFLGPQDSLQKVIPPSQFLKMKQKKIVGKIQSTASSDSKAVASTNQKQNGIGTIKDSKTTYSYKEKGKLDSPKFRQSTETTSYSDSEGNDRKVKTNKENTDATKEDPNSFSIEQQDFWQQLQAKPGSVLDEIENVPDGGITGKKSVPELKTTSSQTEGNYHHTPVRAEDQHEILFDLVETNISMKEEGTNTDPSMITSEDYDISASKSEPENMEKGVESSIHKNSQRIITGLTQLLCQGNTVDTKPNLTHDDESKRLREDCLDGEINDKKRDIADDMSGRNGNASNELHENINFDHSTPSRLPEICHNKNVEEELLEACEGQDNTANHQVKDSDSLERKGNEDKLLGYVEVQNTSPSDLLPRVKERKEVEDISASDGELMHTTPTSLLDRATQCEEMTDHSPGYGEFQYTTPSSLLHSVKEKKEVEDKSPVYCELQYITPTRLFDRHIQSRKMSDQSTRYGEFQYTTPSDLLYRVMERNEGENKSPGYGEFPYTTPSRLLERHVQSEEMSDHSPGYGVFQYTTPSVLLHRAKERNESESKSPGYGELPYTTPSRLLERHVQSEEMSDHSPGYGEFQYTTPSGLLHRAMERNEGESRSPGYGEFPYTTPSRLLERHIQSEEMSGHSPGYRDRSRDSGENKYTSSSIYGELQYTTPSVFLDSHMPSRKMSDQSPGYGEFQYTTPSGLLHRVMNRNEGEKKSPGYGEFPYTTPSRLLERHVQSEEMSDHSPGYGEFQYTTPSGMLHRAMERNEGESRSPGYGEFPYTTPSRLLERHIQSEEMSGHSPGYRDRSRDSGENKYTSSSIYGELQYTTPSVFLDSHMPSRKMSDQSPGYGEFQYTTPSGLLHRVMNRNEGEKKSPGYGEFPCTTPSRLLERHVQSEEMSDHSPGYGEFQYTTPSGLLHRAMERNEGENRSPGYGEFPYTTPSRLLERHVQSEEMSDHSPVYGEFQYTAPSGILHRVKERKICEDKLPGYGEPLYTTPSRFLYRQIQRREVTDQSPGYEEFQYRTPQGLFSRDRKLNNDEDRSPAFGELLYTAPNRLLDRSIQSDKMSDQSPGYGEFQDITPSGLLCRVCERKESENRSPDSGENKQTAFSRLSDMDMKRREIPDHSPCFEESLNTTPSSLMCRDDARQAFEEISPRYGKLCYITPSVLIYKDNKRQDSKEKSIQSGKFQHKMPSQLLAIERRQERNDKSPEHNTFRYSTPSLLLYQELLRRQNVDASSLGHRVPMQDTLIKAKSRTDDEGYGYQEYSTPSQILEKSNKVTYASQSSPCLEYHYSTIPSQMLVRNFDRKKPENVTQGYEFPGNVSPSELFSRRQALEKGRSKPSVDHVHQNLRYPSGPLQMNMHRPYEIEYPLSDGEYQYSAPSRLLEAMNQRGPAEHLTGEASSSIHPLARDHDKNNKHNVSVEYTNPPIFIQKGEDRDQTRRSKTAEYGAFIDSTPLRLIDLENTTRLGQEPSSQSAVLRVCDLKGHEEGIMYQHAAADRNISTASFRISENKVPATVQYPSTASFRISENKVPATVQYPSTASFNKLYSEVPPTIPYSSTTAVGEFQYKTPSGVLHRVKERHEGEDRSLGYGELLYATPYRLLDRSTQTAKICDQSPGYGQFQYRTPSGLLCRVSDRKEGKDRFPGGGEIKYTTSSRVSDMDMKRREITDHLPCFEEVPCTTPSGIIHRDDARQAFEEISPRYGKFCYVTPSVLMHKDSMGQDSGEKSHQSGKFQFKMPSQLLAVERKRGESDDKSPGHHALRYSTPSLLLYQEFLRRHNLDASSPGYRVPMQDTLIKVKSRSEDEGYGYQEYATPSQILEKSDKVTYASQSSPCLEYHYSAIPSQMLVRNFDRKKPENVTQGYEFPGNVSPSELFNRRQALEKGRSKPSEGHVHQYLRRPSGPLQMQMYGPYEIEHLSSDGEYQNITPSRLEVMNQRGPAEPLTGETSSLRHLLARDHDKYDEHNVSVAYTSPPRFFQKREDRDQTRRSETAEYGAFIDSTPLRLIKLENTTKHGQEPSSLSAVLINGDLERQEEEAILYQHEYDNYVVADRNENANNDKVPESSVDPDCGMKPATIRHASIASLQKSESKLPATVQYTSTAGFHKSESEVPATIQNASTASFNKLHSEVPPTIQHSSTSSFNKLECKAAVTIEQASSESFNKSENEVEHAEIIHRLMVVLGNTAVFLAAYTEQEIISLLTIMKTGQEKRSNKCWGKGNGPAENSVQRERCGSIAPFWGNQEVQEPHHVAWMTSVCTLKVLKASLTSKSEADLYQILVDIHSLLACANSFMKEHGNITLDPLIRSDSDYHTSIGTMDVVKGARRMSEPYRWFFSEEFVQTTTLHEFLNMIQNSPQIESSHIVLRTKPFRNVMDGDVSSAEMTVPFRDSVHIQSLFSSPVQQSIIHTSDTQQLPQKMYRSVSSDVSAWDFSNISYTPPNTRRSVIWQNKDGSLSQSVGDFQDFLSGKLPEAHQSKRGSSFSLVINPSFNLSSDEEDLETSRKQDSTKSQIASTPEIKKYDKINKKLSKQGVGKDKSPDRGQRLYASSLGLNWHSDGKRGRGGGRPGTSPEARSFMMEREVIMSQNRKLQGEINTLQTENKLLKEKYNRTRAKIAELENEVQEAQSELATLLETSNQEITELTNRSRSANQKDREQLQSKILALTKENESFKLESASLEKQIESSRKLVDTIHQTGEKPKLLEAQKAELNAVNEQLGRLRALLEQSEQHFHKEEEQHSETRKQVQKLTELNNLLQQQAGATHDEAVIDKQIQSLEKRLKVTEERLYQERADRANNLSQIEEKLLAENAQFQVVEKDLSRQLQREKEKNRNLEKNIKDLREEIEKLHLALPFDESLLTLKKGNYSIPYSGHSSQRAESLRQSNDMNYILAQIEKEDGLGAGQEQDIIRELWNKRKLAYMQLHELEIQLIELGISDNIAEGLKNLRDTHGQAETKMKQMEERLSDMQFEMAALENTYKQQLTVLVHERHDAFAHLKTAEDLLEALKTENQSLKLSLTGSQSAIAHQGGSAADTNAETQLIRSQVQSLESQLAQVVRSNQLLEGELKTLDAQLNSRNLELQESKEELKLLYASLKDDEASNRKQQAIDRLSAQVIDLNAEIGMWNDRNNTLLTENEKLEDTVAVVRKKEISMLKTKQQQRADFVQIEALQEELDEKERKIEHQKGQLYELDGQLQKVHQDLYMEQEHTAELETEVGSLQQTVTQRAQMFEALIGSEREQLAQFQLLKDTLDSVSKELDQKKAQVKSLEIDLSLSKNRVEGLERDLQELRQERSYDTKFHPPPQSSMGDRLRIRELEGERTTLKQELAQLHSTVQLAEERASQAQKELCQLESELVKMKTTILQLTAEKHELEQHLEIAEENNSLIQERGQAEEDLVRLEKKLQEILEKFEQEARKQHSNFETRYVNIPADCRKLLNELDSLRLLLEGKEREAEMIQDRSMRQQMEVSFLQRKVELIQNQMITNREDIARMVSELAIKMKEAVGTREVNQFLVNERAKLQTENYHLEKDLEKEKETKVQIKKEMEEITKKIEKSQEHSKSTEKEAQNKANLIATIETDLRNATRNITHLELEVSQQKNKIEHLNNDIKNLTNINTTLEKRFEMEKNTLAEEKETSRRLKDDVTNMTHKLEMLQHEHQLTQDKLATEQQTVEKLRNQSESYHEECERLKEEISAHKSDLDILRGQVLLGKDAVEKLKQEKEYLSHEYEVLCRHLNDKENELRLHREESLHKMDSLQRELYQEKTTQENNKTLIQKELDLSRSELEKLAEKLHQKEIQLQSFGRTLQELEAINREKREMEANVQRLETLVRDNKVILDGQRKEIMIHIEANSKQQELLAKAEATNQTLYGELRVHQENSQHEIRDLQITIKELQSQHEAERSALAETLTQSQSQLQASQSHLALAADARDKLQGRVRILERDLEEIKSKLSDESTGRHLTEHSVGSLRLQLEDTKNQKIVAEARLSETEKALAKAESQLKIEKEKLKKLSGRIQEAEVNSHSTESSVKAKQEQVDLLQKENNKLRQMLDSQKQNLTSKMKMAMLDLKQQLEMVQNERDKMSSQMQKLSTDLDQSREQIATKNKENYKLQEEILALEDQVREYKIKLKAAEDSLKTETAVQDQLTHRYTEQEEELKVLKNFLAKKAEESGDADKAMWHEMNRVIQELSHQMQSHLESQKQNKEARESPQQIQKHKRQIMDLQGELATERSLHQITRDSLQALEEDCKRLRHQLHVLRRRESSASDKKYKNRMEAINAIIAKSQSQAQALLASGGYHDDISSPRPDYSIYSPRMGYRSPSPRMGYSSPQRAFSPDNSMASEFSIASTGPMVPTFESSASHKSHVRRN